MDPTADRGTGEIPTRKVPWQEKLLGPTLVLEPLLDYPELFSQRKANEADLKRVLERAHPELVEAVIERSRRNSEDDATNPYRINFLLSLYAPTLHILWPPKAEVAPEQEEFRRFCEMWIGNHFTAEEYRSLLHRLIGIKAIMDVKKQFKHEGERPKIKREEAQKIFDFAKIALMIIDEYVGRAVGQEEVKRLIDRCQRRLPGERKSVVHRKYQELWPMAEATKSGTLKLDHGA